VSRDRLLKSLLRERFLVTLKTGETFEGLLDRVDDRTLELIRPVAVTDKGDRVPADGRVYLDRVNVAYMQRPDAP
jgi:hypothetical protein